MFNQVQLMHNNIICVTEQKAYIFPEIRGRFKIHFVQYTPPPYCDYHRTFQTNPPLPIVITVEPVRPIPLSLLWLP